MNVYKPLTFLLAFLLMILMVVLIACVESKQEEKEQKTAYQVEQSEFELLQFLHATDSQLIELWKKMGIGTNAVNQRVHPTQTGRMIGLQEARDKMAAFRRMNGNNQNKPIITPYAFAFGKENIKKLLAAIERENDNLGPNATPLDSIQGVRIYLTLTDTIKGKPYLDLLLVPVKGDGNDYLQLDKLSFLSSDLLLNTSSPCPNMCND